MLQHLTSSLFFPTSWTSSHQTSRIHHSLLGGEAARPVFSRPPVPMDLPIGRRQVSYTRGGFPPPFQLNGGLRQRQAGGCFNPHCHPYSFIIEDGRRRPSGVPDGRPSRRTEVTGLYTAAYSHRSTAAGGGPFLLSHRSTQADLGGRRRKTALRVVGGRLERQYAACRRPNLTSGTMVQAFFAGIFGCS